MKENTLKNRKIFFMAAASSSSSSSSPQQYEFMEHIAPLLSKGGQRSVMAASSLIKICDNLLDQPTKLRYRRLPADGAAFHARLSSVPGALEVLAHLGFTRVTYPDRDYYVLHDVNALHIGSVRRELSVFVDTAARLEAARAAQKHVDDVGSHDADEMKASTVDAGDSAAHAAMHERRTAGSDGGRRAAGVSIERQLAARRAVHRVAASQHEQRTAALNRRWRTGVLAVLTLAAAILAWTWTR